MASPRIDSLKQALRAAEEAKLQGPLREEAEKKLQVGVVGSAGNSRATPVDSKGFKPDWENMREHV